MARVSLGPMRTVLEARTAPIRRKYPLVSRSVPVATVATTSVPTAGFIPFAVKVTCSPLTVAVKLLAPATVPSVQLPTVAIPSASVVTVAPVTSPPPEETAKLTTAPDTAVPSRAFTSTAGATATADPTAAVWLSPLNFVTIAGTNGSAGTSGSETFSSFEHPRPANRAPRTRNRRAPDQVDSDVNM